MQLCFVVSHSLTTVSFCLKDSSLCCIASYDALRLIFYTSHQYRIYNYIFVILSLFTQGQMFGINFHCSVVAVSTPSSHSVSTAIYQFHPGASQTERDITTTLLVGVDSSPLNCSGFTSVRSLCARRAFHLNAHVSIERKSSSSDTLLHTSHFLLSCDLITNV